MATTNSNTRIVSLTASAAEVDSVIGGQLRSAGLLPQDFVLTDLRIEPSPQVEGEYSIVCTEYIPNA